MGNEVKTASIHRLIKRAGAERVSNESAEFLSEILEELGLKIAREAIDFTEHAGRKTVKKEDIEIAADKVLERFVATSIIKAVKSG